MKVVLQSGYGNPAAVLRVVDLPAEAPAADEVVVRMEAAAMHIADLRTITGEDVAFRYPLPRTPGFEGIGRIVRVGSAVTDHRVGDRVFPALGSGSFREEVCCKATGCLPAPTSGDALQLSLLTVNGPTAEVLLEDFADLKSGDWLIQNAANSSCGRYLIRLARLKGVRTVSVVRRAEMVEELRELGGDVVLVDGPDLPQQVAAAVGGAPVKLGIDAVAGAATERIAECLAPGSTIACYGAMSEQRCEIDFYLMFRKDIRLLGVSFVRQFQLRRTPQQVRAMYARLAELMARGELVAKIAGVYALDQVVEACAHAARSGAERDGKVILKMS
ncbi:MAG: zinc-dependent alcohol dehydrogenase family protein [Sinobacteraceae bacterium]|nr:zinc-dependent alcohol dehydrogenase family protein [Nevskiaceae bacterium]MCP5360830.1 zinc-dependent alcohol dehydrogenase family protein [Nevskiaceae bacterium]